MATPGRATRLLALSASQENAVTLAPNSVLSSKKQNLRRVGRWRRDQCYKHAKGDARDCWGGQGVESISHDLLPELLFFRACHSTPDRP